MSNLKGTALAVLIVALAFLAVLWYGHSQRAAGREDERQVLKPDSAQHQLDSLKLAYASEHQTAQVALTALAHLQASAGAKYVKDSLKTDSLERRLRADTGSVSRADFLAFAGQVHLQLVDLTTRLQASDSTNHVLAALVRSDSSSFQLALGNASKDIEHWKYLAEHRGVSRCGLEIGAGAAVNWKTAAPGLTFGFGCRL